MRLNYLNYTIILGKDCFFFPSLSLIYRNIFAVNLKVPSDTARHLLSNAVAPREGKKMERRINDVRTQFFSEKCWNLAPLMADAS